jgi:hypothetical protein
MNVHSEANQGRVLIGVSEFGEWRYCCRENVSLIKSDVVLILTSRTDGTQEHTVYIFEASVQEAEK